MAPFLIIVVHRPQRQLPDCLEAVCNFSDRGHELVILDAAGESGNPDYDALLSASHSSTRQVVDGGDGPDLVKACNAVLKASQDERVIILDSAAIAGEHWLENIGDCLDTAPGAGVVGPLTAAYFTGSPAGATNQIALTGRSEYFPKSQQALNRHRRIAVRAPDLLCLAVRLTTVCELGYLDETCAAFDVALADLCVRCEMAGHQNYLVGDIYVQGVDPQPPNSVTKALQDKWRSLDPESELRKHYEALHLYWEARQACRREEAERAVELFLKGIGLYPAEQKLYLDLASMLTDAGQHSDALQTLQEMPGAKRSMAAQLITGKCQRGMGQPIEAMETAGDILAADEKSAAGWWLQGTLLADRGENDRAQEAYQKGLSFDPGYGLGYTALGDIDWAQSAGENALELLERGFALAPDAVQTATAYHMAVSQSQAYARAIPVFTDAVTACWSSRRLRYLLIDVLLKAGEPSQAMDAIESVLTDFGVEEGLLAAALAIRDRLGPLAIEEKEADGATIAFCLIVRDEEVDLPRCLSSIKPVANEIVVVDTGSQDRTIDIARVFGARVFNFEWCDDFSAAKNFAASKADAQWIFSIDADEVLSPLDHDALRVLVQDEKPNPVAFAVTTRNYLKVMDVIGWQPNNGSYPEEDGLGWMPSVKVRLFPNDPRVRFTYPVHEMVEPSLEEAGIPIIPCNIPVHHYGKLDQDRSLAKGETYYKIGKKKLKTMQNSLTGIRELAVQAQTLGHYLEAARLWERLLTLDPGETRTYINLGSAYLEMGNYEKAIKMAGKARKLDPSVKESHFNMALSMLYAGDAPGATGILEELVEKFPEYIAAYFILAAAHCCSGAEHKANKTMDELKHTSLRVGLPDALRHLANGLERAGQSQYWRRVLKFADRMQARVE